MKNLLNITGDIGSEWGITPDYVRYLLNQHANEEVHIGFSSLGGGVKAGLEIYQAIKDHGNVIAHAFGMNASIATVAMQGAKRIDIVEGGLILVHNALMPVLEWNYSNKDELRAIISRLELDVESLENIDDTLATIYAKRSGKDIDEIKAQMTRGNWMTAKEAVERGYVDEINSEKADEQTRREIDKYNLLYNSMYAHQLPPLTDEAQAVAANNTAEAVANTTEPVASEPKAATAQSDKAVNELRQTVTELSSTIHSMQEELAGLKNEVKSLGDASSAPVATVEQGNVIVVRHSLYDSIKHLK